jgi:hypothetical protein
VTEKFRVAVNTSLKFTGLMLFLSPHPGSALQDVMGPDGVNAQSIRHRTRRAGEESHAGKGAT